MYIYDVCMYMCIYIYIIYIYTFILFYNKKKLCISLQKKHMVKTGNIHKFAVFIFYENRDFLRVFESSVL